MFAMIGLLQGEMGFIAGAGSVFGSRRAPRPASIARGWEWVASGMPTVARFFATCFHAYSRLRLSGSRPSRRFRPVEALERHPRRHLPVFGKPASHCVKNWRDDCIVQTAVYAQPA